MARTRARAKRARQSASTDTSSLGSSLTTVPSTMSDMTTMTDGSTSSYLPGTYGPSAWVDPVTYRKLKAQFSKARTTKKRKTSTKKKTTTKRKSYRRSYGGGGYSRNLSGMGPIVITGRGGYWTDKLKSGASAAWKSLGRLTPEGTFNRLGQAAGGAMFGKPGAGIGGYLGSGVSSVLGFGDYAIKKNDLMMLDEGTPVPTFQDMNQGIVVCHREYIGDIVQSQAFVNTTYVIQPGDSTTFPWLSKIASQFEQYELLGCLFQFRSTASDFGTTTNMAMGSVIMATDYDTVDAAYQSKLEMENSQFAMSGKPSHDILHPIECDPSVVGPNGLKYVRNGPVPAGKDNRLYDHGNFQIATTGMPAATGTIGELWITYKIAFYKPQFNLGSDILTDFRFQATYDNNNIFGLTPVVVSQSSLGTIVTAGNVMTFPPRVTVGMYFLITIVTNGSSVAINPGAVVAVNAAVVNRQAALGTSSRYLEVITIRVTGPGPVLTWTGLALPSSGTDTRSFVTQIDSEVGTQVG